MLNLLMSGPGPVAVTYSPPKRPCEEVTRILAVIHPGGISGRRRAPPDFYPKCPITPHVDALKWLTLNILMDSLLTSIPCEANTLDTVTRNEDCQLWTK